MRWVPAFFVTVAFAPGTLAQQTQAPAVAAEESPPAPTYEEQVEVVGVTPIHGLGVSRDKIPANIQTASSADIARTPGGQVTDVLSDGFTSVSLNEAQANPFQPDIQFRGFAVSPLLGLPQGVAVYQDGVRVNEPFGDTVNWDLLPTRAIDSINLIPGSNPLFGLNALGGALSVQTKSGFTSPGHIAGAFAGSFGRLWADVQSGGGTEHLSYFVTGRVMSEGGWRDFSDSRVGQLFGSAEWRGAASRLKAAVTVARNRLVGNGPAPVDLLEIDRRLVFTHPDETKTRVGMVTLSGRRITSPSVSVDGVLFYRPTSIQTFNGDGTNYEACEDDDLVGLLCGDAGVDPVVDQFGNLVNLPDARLDATNNRSRTRSSGWGGGLQASVVSPAGGRANSFVGGMTVDAARSRYEADTEIATLTDSRGTLSTGILDSDAAVRLRSTVLHVGFYAANFYSLTSRITVMASGRFTHSRVTLRDQLGDELNGNHQFNNLNPAAGLRVSLPLRLSAFMSFSSASRVPTPSELSCADPDDPCRLPNAFVADPPLRRVLARTWEGGIGGELGSTTWTASTFRTNNRDDIVFISSGSLTNLGHFANVGSTLRRGVELGAVSTLTSAVRLTLGYTYLRATFETPMRLSSPNHPDASEGEIVVSPGRSLPGVPRHNLKAGVSATHGRASLAATVVATSGQYLRGDEANLLSPVDGFRTVNLSGGYTLSSRARLVVRVTNLFDAEYETFGLLGDPGDVLGDGFEDPRFLSPSAPRAAWVGVELGL